MVLDGTHLCIAFVTLIPGDTNSESHLTIDPCSFTQHFREDVISVLRETRKYEVNLIANSWEPIYKTMIDDQ
jgi:hypothetical protein